MSNLFGTYSLNGSLAAEQTLIGTIAVEQGLNGSLTVPSRVENDKYLGSYEVVPTDEEIRISTKDKLLTGDFVIKPIPDNYGKIIWNGSELTIV